MKTIERDDNRPQDRFARRVDRGSEDAPGRGEGFYCNVVTNWMPSAAPCLAIH